MGIDPTCSKNLYPGVTFIRIFADGEKAAFYKIVKLLKKTAQVEKKIQTPYSITSATNIGGGRYFGYFMQLWPT